MLLAFQDARIQKTAYCGLVESEEEGSVLPGPVR